MCLWGELEESNALPRSFEGAGGGGGAKPTSRIINRKGGKNCEMPANYVNFYSLSIKSTCREFVLHS